MFNHLRQCCNHTLRSIQTDELDSSLSEGQIDCVVCCRPIKFDYRVVYGLGGSSTHSLSAAAYCLANCCEDLLGTLSPTVSQPVNCPTCGRRFIVETAPLQEQRPEDEVTNPEDWINSGRVITGGEYVD